MRLVLAYSKSKEITTMQETLKLERIKDAKRVWFFFYLTFLSIGVGMEDTVSSPTAGRTFDGCCFGAATIEAKDIVELDANALSLACFETVMLTFDCFIGCF